jgi:hypothetical protein
VTKSKKVEPKIKSLALVVVMFAELQAVSDIVLYTPVADVSTGLELAIPVKDWAEIIASTLLNNVVKVRVVPEAKPDGAYALATNKASLLLLYLNVTSVDHDKPPPVTVSVLVGAEVHAHERIVTIIVDPADAVDVVVSVGATTLA